jgi:hypothetical protein
MGDIVMSNVLGPDFPQRARIERAVRAAVESADADQSWSIRLHPSDEPDRVAIEVEFPKGGVAATSVAALEDDATIVRRVQSMLHPYCGK